MAGRQRGRGGMWVDVLAVGAIAAASLWALQPYHFGMLTTPWQPSFAAVLPDTAAAAARVWAFWGSAALVLGLLLLRAAPDLGRFDALLGGALGMWVIAYVGGNLLGPVGLLRGWALWLAVALGGLGLGWLGAPRLGWPAVSPGRRLALLTLAIATPGLLLLQLGAPVPPHFDVFAPAAAAQRIVTFGRYLPWDNDPYGYWGSATACPGTELFYGLLALGGGTLAVLAETAAIVPMAALLVLATYRLGRTLGGDLAGGMATLLLFATVFFRVLPYGHGRYVAFVPVVAGLAFVLDPRRHPLRLGLGALLLATGVAAHAIIGAFGMLTVAATAVLWLLASDVAGAVAAVGLLGGATLVALPTVLVALQVVVPYPTLPVLQLLGIGLVILAARRMPRRPPVEPWWATEALLLVAVAVIVRPPPALALLDNYWACLRYPVLTSLGGLGLALLAVTRTRAERAPMVAAVLAGVTVSYAGDRWQGAVADPAVSVAIHDLSFKAEFWLPLALVFPAACLAARLAERLPARPVTWALLAVLWLPWRYDAIVGALGVTGPMQSCVSETPLRDPNYSQVSIAEGLAEHLVLAKRGYWGVGRWAQTPAELTLMDVLRVEIAAGRITIETHVAHLAPLIYLFQDPVLFSVYTGINDDVYMAQYHFDRAMAGGRIRPIEDVHAALAGYRYVVVHDRTSEGIALADTVASLPRLDGYEKLFDQGGVRLFRAR